ncbi:hypothetical protein Ga0074812_13747 [Parafrankia irregularis]|uniref:Uncharacterized protein n=1 Tax=Parafrankia irregularis TaxID=795642 RepID=A0A0S4QXK8_9ACTN|nr:MULTISPECIES: hypothetical protein [Parafrankia]MBE3203399.1 hypothetical protein [Parafrankia sp. CH37]CUU60263.1 hypothetical protein Ga0074812_13747 [Parafrankia irregularis]
MIALISGVLAALAMIALVVGIVGMLRGRIGFLGIDDRPMAGLLTAASFTVAVATFGVLATGGDRPDATVTARPLGTDPSLSDGYPTDGRAGDLGSGLPRAAVRQFPAPFGSGGPGSYAQPVVPPWPTMPGSTAQGQVLPGQVLPGQVLPGQTSPGPAFPGDGLPAGVRPGQDLAGPGALVPPGLVPGGAAPGLRGITPWPWPSSSPEAPDVTDAAGSGSLSTGDTAGTTGSSTGGADLSPDRGEAAQGGQARETGGSPRGNPRVPPAEGRNDGCYSTDDGGLGVGLPDVSVWDILAGLAEACP